MKTALVMHTSEFSHLDSDEKKVNLAKYKAVAIVHVDSDKHNVILNKAYELTNHIDKSWTENDGVTVIGDNRKRSTSVGDLVWIDSDMYRVDSFGFSKVTY